MKIILTTFLLIFFFNSWQLYSQTKTVTLYISMSDYHSGLNWNSSVWKIRSSKSSDYTYVGEINNGLPNGKGVFSYPYRDTKYVGEFKDGYPHGQGTFTFSGGSKHVGEFKNGEPNGQGTWTYDDGRVLSGIWKDSRLVESQ